MLRDLLLLLVNIFNDVIILYFFVANGTYTVLVALSFVYVWLYQKRIGYAGLQDVRESPVTPPVTIIVPAYNEADSIISTVESLMTLDYPSKEIIIVDDGSTDDMVPRLIERFGLVQMDLIYRPQLQATKPSAFYHDTENSVITLVSKPNGGKADALNVGVNMARSPYVCTVDADCIVEKDALLRLMYPVIRSPINTVVSAGIIRLINGCKVENGRVTEIRLPKRAIEKFQVVEYLRSFLFGRTGWNLLKATLIASGAFCIFHRESLIMAGAFSRDTITEDMDVIACLHKVMREKKRQYQMCFSSDPVCWTLAPDKMKVLARQRRRWQLGLVQTVMKHHYMLFNFRYRTLGLASMPFHVFVEALGCLVEFLGYVLVPVGFLLGITPLSIFLLFILLSGIYGALLSVAGVLLEELTYRRYPRMRDLLHLLLYASVENLGYRQLTVFFRVQALVQYLRGKRKWEVIQHRMAPAEQAR